MPTGADLFVQSLSSLGIDRIFTLVGDHLNEVLSVASRAGIHILDMRHESGVAHAADAWARIKRRPAVALVTGGPGHTNSLTGVATAHLAGSPLIAVSGSRANAVANRQAFQDIEQLPMTQGVVKWAAEPTNPAQIPYYLGRAYTEANCGRKGAVHLTIPVDVFTGTTDLRTPLPVPPNTAAALPNPDSIQAAIELLRAAERPIVIAGSGVWWAEAERELREFIETTSLPLYTITMAKGVISDEHSLVMGYADPALNLAVRQAFQEADLFLIVGKRIDFRLAFGGARLFPAAAKFIQIDIHGQELGLNRTLNVAICADAKQSLAAMTKASGADKWKALPWLDRLRSLKREAQRTITLAAHTAGQPLHPAAFYLELQRALPHDVLYSWDGGDFAHWGRAIMPALGTAWLRLGPLGAIGSALPNGLALQLANPGERVAIITGDGALGFYIAELDSAVRHGLPVVIIVGNDGGWGLERELQGAGSGDSSTVACELRRTRYDIIMQGFGGQGETIDRLDQVQPAVKRALASGVPYLLNVNIQGMRSPFTDWQIAGKRK